MDKAARAEELRKKSRAAELRAKSAAAESSPSPADTGAFEIPDDIAAQDPRSYSMDFEGLKNAAGDAFNLYDRTIPGALRTHIAAAQEGSLEPYERYKQGTPATAEEIGKNAKFGAYLFQPGQLPNSDAIDRGVGMALGAATDPLTFAGGEALGAVAGPLGKAADWLGLKAMRGAGHIGHALTLGQITADGQEAARAFTPMEQIFASDTLRNQGKLYGPMKATMDDGAHTLKYGRMRQDAARALDAEMIHPGTNPADMDKSLTATTDAWVRQHGSPNLSPEVMATISEPVKTPPQLLKSAESVKRAALKIPSVGGSTEASALLEKLRDLGTRGYSTPVEMSELLDNINRIEYSQLGNERAVWHDLGSALVDLRGAAEGALEGHMGPQAAEYMANRTRYHQAAIMARGRPGGAMTGMLRNLNAAQEIGRAVAEGNPASLAGGLAAFAAHFPGAWNAVAGSLRLTGVPMEAAAQMILKDPALRTAVAGWADAQIRESQENGSAGGTALDAIRQSAAMGAPPQAAPPPTSPAQAIFMRSAAQKPALLIQLAGQVAKNGRQDLAYIFQDAARMGLENAAIGWGADLAELQAVALEAAKGSPQIKAAMRKSVTDDATLPMEEKARRIQAINDNTIFNSTPPSGP